MQKTRHIRLVRRTLLFFVGCLFLAGIFYLFGLNSSSDFSVMMLDVMALLLLIVAASSILSLRSAKTEEEQYEQYS